MAMNESDLGYLAGLIDGEGHLGFVVNRIKRGRSAKFQFVIVLRNDDRPVLEWVQRVLGYGTIYHIERKGRANPQTRFVVTRIKECERLGYLLSRAPLRSKKRDELKIWMEAIRIARTLTMGGRQNGLIWAHLEGLADGLKARRQYKAPEVIIRLQKTIRTDVQGQDDPGSLQTGLGAS
jgi:hypothetical protein